MAEAETYKSYPFWYLSGTKILGMLHRASDYLKDYRVRDAACTYGSQSRDFCFKQFAYEVKGILELITPALEIKKIKIKIPKEILETPRISKETEENYKKLLELYKNSVTKWVNVYNELVKAIHDIGITDLRKADDDPDKDDPELDE